MIEKKPRGSKLMMANGKKPMLLWFTPEQHAALRAAAFTNGVPMTRYVMRAALAALSNFQDGTLRSSHD